MLGWIFFNPHWGGVSKTKCWGGGSLLLAIVHLLNLKNGADAIKTESITDSIFFAGCPRKISEFYSSLFTG